MDSEGPTPAPDRARRVSITRLQRASAAVADLLNLCQTITADGHLADEEIEGLKQWLTDNAELDLPARDFLIQTVRRVLEDRKVTADERREVYLAIEKILPPDLRQDVRGARVERDTAEKALARERLDAAKAAAREERLRNQPIRSWNFMVAGVRYENRPSTIRQHVSPGDDVFVARDPANRYSANACEIRLENGMQIGFVPEEYATEIAPLLDSGHLHYAYLTKILTGGRSPIPVVQLQIFRPDATQQRLVRQDSVPAKHQTPSKAGCMSVLLLIAVPLGLSSAFLP